MLSNDKIIIGDKLGVYEQPGYNLGTGFVDPSDISSKNLKQMKDEFYQSNYPSQSALWAQGAIDKRFKAGDQGLYGYLGGLQTNQNFARWFFNLIRRHINMVAGYQRRNRKSTIMVPIHDNDDPLSDDYNKVLRWCDDRDGFQEYLSESFEGCLDTGMTLLYMYPSYVNDPVSGDLMTDCVSYNNYLIDQFFRKQDLSDCNGIWRRRWTSKIIAKSLLKGYEKEIDKMKLSGMKDGRFPVQAELQNLQMTNLFPYDEFHYRTTREAKVIIDPKTGESTEWDDEEDGEDSEYMLQAILASQPWLKVKTMQVPTVKLIISLGDYIVYHGPNLLGIDDYPCVPTLCYYDPDIPQYALRCMGMIRNMRDAQFLYNMRKIIELQILQSQINAGWIYPVDAVTDPKCFRQASGGDAFLVPLKAGRLPSEIQRIEPSAIPQSLIELSASLAEDITKISGVNEELLGSATDDKAAVLSMLRQGAGLTTLQTIFDKLDYTQRIYGKIRLAAIRKNFSKSKVERILGKPPEKGFFLNYSQKYSMAVEEGNYSTTQRQMELQQLLQFRELGMAIPDKSILRAAFISNKTQVMQDMEEAQQQQAQMQQQQAEQQAKMDEAKIMQAMTKSQLDMAKVQESMAKVDELEASADHKKAQTEFDLVKSMLELENLDLETIQRSYQIAMEIKGQNTENQNQTSNVRG